MSGKKKYAVILAGGAGTRAGGQVPKQFQIVGDTPMFWRSVMAFHQEDPSTKILLVMHPGFFDLYDLMMEQMEESEKIELELVCGGASRLHSVANALGRIPGDKDILVAVHDAARPLVTPELIRRGWEAGEKWGAAVPVVAVTDSLRRLTPDGSRAVDRSDYRAVQTPQVFQAALIEDAYSREWTDEMTDDASVAEAAGVEVEMYEGDLFNIKVTNPLDIDIADLLLRHRGQIASRRQH